jgi:hypothetical protein
MQNNLPWIPGGANGGDKAALSHRDQCLIAIRLTGRLRGGPPFWDFHVVDVQFDRDGCLKFRSNDWRWEWEDVSYYVPLSGVELPKELQ